VETIGSKRSYALTWCMPNNDDDDDDDDDDDWVKCCMRIEVDITRQKEHLRKTQ